MKPKWLGVYINADEIEKSLRSEGSLLPSITFWLSMPKNLFINPTTSTEALNYPENYSFSII